MSFKIRDWLGDPKYVAASKALVIDNQDPLKKGRIKVKSPVFGEQWVYFATPDDGLFAPPDINTVVYVEADGGNPDYLICRGVINDGPDSSPDTRVEFQRDVPTNRGWASPGELTSTGEAAAVNAGHILELDDGIAILSDGSVTHTKEMKGVRITTSGGHFLKMFEEEGDGSQFNRIELGTIDGQLLQMVDDNDAAKQNITLKDKDSRTIEIIKETDRIRIRNASGTIYIDVDFANDTIEVDANIVKLGTSASEAIVRGDTFRALFNSHTHPTPAGPSSPPFQPMDPPSANTHLSDRHKVE